MRHLLRESRARCIERFQGAGISRELATVLADDFAVGASGHELHPSQDRPLVVLVGDFGSGKSLRAERLYHEALRRCLVDLDAPIPIYVEAFPNKLPSLADLRVLASSLGDVEHVGAALFVERSDEGGHKHAFDCLALGRQAAAAWPSTIVMMPSRPVSAFVEIPEAVEVPLLTLAEACALVSRVSGHPFEKHDLWRWSGMLHEALLRPLFAILVGLYLQTEYEYDACLSAGDLIERVITQALRRARLDVGAAETLLSRLGVISVEHGGEFVHYSQLGGRLEVESAFASGLAARRGDEIGFAIPVVGQWFAAQAIAQRRVTIEEIFADRHRLELWRYPLSIAAAAFDKRIVHDLLQRLALSDPGLAALVLDDAVGRSFDRQPTTVRTSSELEVPLQAAWSSWVGGIGELAGATSAVAPGDRPLSIRTRMAGAVLSIGWYREDSPEATPHSLDGPLPRGWIRSMTVSPASGRPTWPWQFTLEEIKRSVSEILRRHALSSDDGNPLAVEAVWSGALALTGRGSLHPGPIPLQEIERALGGCIERVGRVRSYDYGDVDISLIAAAVMRLREKGQTELLSPLPVRDVLAPTDNWVWSVYSDSRLLERTHAAYDLAIAGYSHMVERWFSRFRFRMFHAVTLPATFRGVLHPSRLGQGETDPRKHPGLDYWFEPLPDDCASKADIVLEPATGFLVDSFDELAWSNLRRMRPDAAGWIWSATGSTALDVFGSCPATKIAYEWIASDLRRIKWA